MLKLYHAEPVANSLKVLIPLHEKQVPFESRYVDLHKFEQHESWFIELNPEGQVPVLVHDDKIVTQTSVINEYLEDIFPGTPLRPADPWLRAQMRIWNKFVDEHVMNYVSMHGWHRMIRTVAQSIEKNEFERLLARIPLKEQRDKWRTVAGDSFSPEQLGEAERKIDVAVQRFEAQLAKTPWLAGEEFTLADINAYCHCGMMVARMFPHIANEEKCPRTLEWAERVSARPGVQAARAMPDHTDPRLRTFTGEAS